MPETPKDGRAAYDALRARYGAPSSVANATTSGGLARLQKSLATNPLLRRVIREAVAEERFAPVTKAAAMSHDAEQVMRALGQLVERSRVRKAQSSVSDPLVTAAQFYEVLTPAQRKPIDRALDATTRASRLRAADAVERAVRTLRGH